MERTVKFEYENKEYKLVFTSGIELDFLEEYEVESIFDVFKIAGSKRVDAVISLLKAMNEKAGGLQIAIPDYVCPADMMVFQSAMLKAITLGFKREVLPDEIDEGLAELEKKKEEQPAHISWFSRVFAWVFQSKKRTTRRRG